MAYLIHGTLLIIYTKERFNHLLAQAQESHSNRPISPSIQTFFTFARDYMQALNERNDFKTQRLLAESVTVVDLQSELQDCLNDMTAFKADARQKISILTFRDNVNCIVKKQLKDKRFIDRVGHSAREFAIETNLQADLHAALVSKKLLEDNFELLENRLETTFEQNVRLHEQNNRLQSRLSEFESRYSKPNILNSINWGKTQWASFGVGVLVGEQVVEQFTSYQPVRNIVCHFAKKCVGKNGKPGPPPSFPSELLPNETAKKTHTAVVSVETVKLTYPQMDTGV